MYNYTWRIPLAFISLCQFPFSPLLYPFLLTWNPPSCDRNRPPRSQFACKLTSLAPPITQPSPLQIPRTPTAQRLTKTTSGTIRLLLSGTLHIVHHIHAHSHLHFFWSSWQAGCPWLLVFDTITKRLLLSPLLIFLFHILLVFPQFFSALLAFRHTFPPFLPSFCFCFLSFIFLFLNALFLSLLAFGGFHILLTFV